MESTKIREFYLSFPYSVSLTMELIFYEVFPLNILGNVAHVTRSQNCKIVKIFSTFLTTRLQARNKGSEIP